MMRGFIDGEYQDGELRGIDFLVGMRGFGKTTEMARLGNECSGGAACFDPLSQHAMLFPGAQIIEDQESLTEYLRINRGRRFRIVYQPRKGDLTLHFRKFCSTCFIFGWMILLLDEVDKFCGPRFGPSWMPEELSDLINYGRHARISMLVTARRPQGVAAALKAECSWRIFRLKDGKALDAISAEIGEEHVSRLRELPKYFYLRFLQDQGPSLCGGPRGL